MRKIVFLIFVNPPNSQKGEKINMAAKVKKITTTGIPMSIIEGTKKRGIIFERGGHTWVKISDLMPHPKNEEIYADETAEGKKQMEMASDFKVREKQGLPPNTQYIRIWPDGTIHSGHTRVASAKAVGITELRAEYTDKPYPDSTAPYDDVKNLLSENIIREETLWVKLGKYNALLAAYEEQHNTVMPSSIRKELEKRLGSSWETLKKLNEIKETGRKDLMADVVAGKSVEHCWKDAKNLLMSHQDKKEGGIDLFNIFKDGMKTKIISKSITHAKKMRKLNMPFEFGEVTPFDRSDLSWESGAFTTFLSHTVMTAVAGVLKEAGYEVQTANGHRDDPDIYLVNDDEKIEVKVTQFNGNGHATSWKGGSGSRGGEYILVAHDVEFENIFVMMSTLDKEDWKSAGNRGGTTMPLNLWWKNHEDKGDYVFWKGKIKNVKTNSNPKGIVTMDLEDVDE